VVFTFLILYDSSTVPRLAPVSVVGIPHRRRLVLVSFSSIVCLAAGQFVATELDSTVRDINSVAGDVDLATPDLDYAAEEGGLDELAASARWCGSAASSSPTL